MLFVFNFGIQRFSGNGSPLLWVVLCLPLAHYAHADILLGKVIVVADGDTITVLDDTRTQHTIRLSGIDAPEKKQPFGNRSKESLSNLGFSKVVTVDTEKRDRYGREVGKVLVNGVDANLEQVKRGMAWHYKAYAREQSLGDRVLYSEAEAGARRVRVGLWREEAPQPPWEFRHK